MKMDGTKTAFYAAVGAPVVATRKVTDTLTELSTKFAGDFRKEYGMWASRGREGRRPDRRPEVGRGLHLSGRRRQHLRAGGQAARPAGGPRRHMAAELQPGEAGRGRQGGEGRDRRSRRKRSHKVEKGAEKAQSRSRRPPTRPSRRWRRRPRRPRAPRPGDTPPASRRRPRPPPKTGHVDRSLITELS